MSSQMSAAASAAASTPITPTKLRLSRTRLIKKKSTPSLRQACVSGSDLEHGLAKLPAVFEIAVSCSRIRQWEYPIDDRANGAGEEEPGGLQQLCLLPHVRTDQRQLAPKEVAQIHGRIVSGCGTARHQASALGQTANAHVPCRFSDMFDNDVGAAASRDFLDLRRYIVGRVIDGRPRAQFFGLRELLGRSCGG